MSLTYPFEQGPEQHQAVTIHPHIKWVRSPLPFSLSHINCYLLKDGDGWCVVDTGMNGEASIAQWQTTINAVLEGAPITRVIATHHHPDHIGLAGWFCDTYRAAFYTTELEYFYTRTFHAPKRKEKYWESVEYFDRTAMKSESKDALLADNNYHHMVWEIPSSFHRLQDQQTLTIGDFEWQAITTRGHSPEHLSLYCKELDLLISGDQVLPEITSNVSITSTQAYANPLQDWYDAHHKIQANVPDSVTVLPAHQLPFKGLHERLAQVLAHHEERLDKILTLSHQEKTAQQLTDELFERDMDAFQNFLAVGECMAHINMLLDQGKMQRRLDDGLWLFSRLTD